MSLRVYLLQLCLLICTSLATPGSARTLVIGTISDEPVKEIRTYLPFARYLAEKLDFYGIDNGEVVIARNIDHMADLIRTGRVDLFFDSPMAILAVNRMTGSQLLVRRWKSGLASYHSVVFTRNNNDIAEIEDLNGRVLAFEESYSSSGHLLPRIALADLGLPVTHIQAPLFEIPSDQVGCMFTGDDDTTLEWVLRGQVDAGAMSRGNFEKRAAANRSELKIILQTAEIPRDLVSATASLPQPLLAAIETTLLTLHQSVEGAEVLKTFERTSKFDRLPQEILSQLERYQEPVMSLVGRH